MKKNSVGLLILLFAGASFAEVSFAPVFNDGAVLQCEMPVNIWGKADPGATVTVLFAGQEKSAVASGSGEWMLQLDPMTPSSEPRKLIASSSIGNQQSSISNVVVGEVWLATGQSNMEMTLHRTVGGPERLAMTLPEIRFFKVPRQTGLPPKAMTAAQLAWKTFKPGANDAIAAVAFYFAEYLQKNTGVNVGIIQSSYGGTPCQSWTPMQALDEKPELKHYADAIRRGISANKPPEEWQAEVDAFRTQYNLLNEWNRNQTGPKPPPAKWPSAENLCFPQSPVVLYENMIRPLIPYTARGVIWYQGEGNAGKPDEYRILFPVMIEAWRQAWNRPDWPFLFVQLAAYNQLNMKTWPELRAAQTFTRDTVPHTGMALAIDCGEKNDIHPRVKQPVGERLARLALADVYGQKVVSRGPAFQTLEKKDGKLFVIFHYSEDGLKTSDGKAEVPGFEAAGADGKFYPASARIISKDTVELGCAEVKKPVSVRYAWYNWVEPPVTLQNSAGLPAEPFSRVIKEK
jgi:sialate O-acetylesterase